MNWYTPLCMCCNKIRDSGVEGEEVWIAAETYFDAKITGLSFSHAICSQCTQKYEVRNDLRSEQQGSLQFDIVPGLSS